MDINNYLKRLKYLYTGVVGKKYRKIKRKMLT